MKTTCPLCRQLVLLNQNTGKLRLHTVWISGYFEECAFSKKDPHTDALVWAKEIIRMNIAEWKAQEAVRP